MPYRPHGSLQRRRSRIRHKHSFETFYTETRRDSSSEYDSDGSDTDCSCGDHQPVIFRGRLPRRASILFVGERPYVQQNFNQQNVNVYPGGRVIQRQGSRPGMIIADGETDESEDSDETGDDSDDESDDEWSNEHGHDNTKPHCRCAHRNESRKDSARKIKKNTSKKQEALKRKQKEAKVALRRSGHRSPEEIEQEIAECRDALQQCHKKAGLKAQLKACRNALKLCEDDNSLCSGALQDDKDTKGAGGKAKKSQPKSILKKKVKFTEKSDEHLLRIWCSR